jgi:hypothetical protein
MTNFAMGCFLMLTNLSYRREEEYKTTVHSFWRVLYPIYGHEWS